MFMWLLCIPWETYIWDQLTVWTSSSVLFFSVCTNHYEVAQISTVISRISWSQTPGLQMPVIYFEIGLLLTRQARVFADIAGHSLHLPQG